LAYVRFWPKADMIRPRQVGQLGSVSVVISPIGTRNHSRQVAHSGPEIKRQGMMAPLPFNSVKP